MREENRRREDKKDTRLGEMKSIKGRGNKEPKRGEETTGEEEKRRTKAGEKQEVYITASKRSGD